MEYITIEKAVEKLYSTIYARPILGARRQTPNPRELSAMLSRHATREVYSQGWDRGWGCGCSLELRLKEWEHKGRRCLIVESEITWSSTSRSITAALNANALYREVIELAAYLEHEWNSEPAFYFGEEPEAQP